MSRKFTRFIGALLVIERIELELGRILEEPLHSAQNRGFISLKKKKLMKKVLFTAILMIPGLITFAQNDPLTESFEQYCSLLQDAFEMNDAVLLSNLLADSLKVEKADGTLVQAKAEWIREMKQDPYYGKMLETTSHQFRYQAVRGQPGFVSKANSEHLSAWFAIKTNGLRLRKLPSSSGTVVALMNEGIYKGMLDGSKPTITEANGDFKWIPVRVEIENKTYSGYVADPFVSIIPNAKPTSIEVSMTKQGWKVTALRTAPPVNDLFSPASSPSPASECGL